MEPEIKERWLKALKSGDFKQGRDRLYNEANKSYCCLGVLCAIENRTGFDIGNYVFCNNIIGRDVSFELIDINDSSEDFEAVIEYITDKL